ncbi:MAG TPA: DUF4986 domain-containing protein, partial [Paludibacter sp.]
EESTNLTINVDAPTQFKLLVRHPAWVPAGAMKVICGTDTFGVASLPSTYVTVNRTWNGGETVKVLLPMHNSIEQLPNVPSYLAILHGPILLGAKTGTEDLLGLVADDSRWGHIASGTMLPLDKAPILVGDRTTFSSQLIPVPGKPLNFSAPGLFVTKADSALTLEPFYRIHDSRYMMYWLTLTKAEYQAAIDKLATDQKAALLLEARTIDKVAPGEQQPEVDHKLKSLNSTTGNYQNEFWRGAGDCSGGSGGFFSYNMLTKKEANLSLLVRYWGNEACTRTFDILIDGVKLITENIVGKWNKSDFVNQEYLIPDKMSVGKDSIVVRFQAPSGAAGGIYYLRVLRAASAVPNAVSKTEVSTVTVNSQDKKLLVSGLTGDSTIQVYDICGRMIKTVKTSAVSATVQGKPGANIVKVISGNKTSVHKVIVN